MTIDFAGLLPDEVGTYEGYGFVRVIVAVLMIAVVARSVIHLLAEDGGARRIAGVDTSVEGGGNVVAMFHQWGAVQLTLIIVLGILFVRYPGLTPLVLCALALDPITRAIASRRRKLTSTKTPPGARLNWPVFGVLVVLLVFSLLD